MTVGSGILGITQGLLIGLLAVGIVLVYKSNRFLNLAHAQLGALSAQLLSKMVLDWGWSWWLAFLVCVPVGALLAVLIDRWIIGPMRAKGASPVSLLLVTIGITQLLLAFAIIPSFGASGVKLVARGYPVPFHTSIHVGGVILGGADVMVLLLVPVLVVALAAFLRLTLLGKMIRAAASNPDAARLAGVSTARVSAITWAVAGALSAVAAILQSPSESSFTAATLGPELLLLALGAAALGAFTSLPGALAGGVVIGLAQQLTLAATSNAGLSELAVFIVIIAIVLIRGPAIGRVFSVSGPVVQDRPPIRVPDALRDRFVARYQRAALVTGSLALALLAPLVPILHSEGKRFQLTLVLIYVIVSLSLTIAIGWAGQVSLGQFALVGAGAFVAAHLMHHGWSIPLLVIVCGLVGASLMVLVGLPALRVPGLTLAVTTLGLAVVAPDWLFNQKWFGTTRSYGIDLDPPSVVRGLGHPAAEIVVYYLALALVVIAATAMSALRRSQPGRLVIAVRDNERKAASFGVTPETIKLAALSLSGFLAASAGVLWADAWRTVAAGQFGAELSLSVLAAPVIGGIGSIAGAIVGALVIYLPTYFLSPYLKSVFGTLGQNVGVTLLFGGVGLILVLRAYPSGIVGALQGWWQSRLDRMAAKPRPLLDHAPTGALRVTDVSVTFGGISALDGVAIEVRPGEIVGLIGPNGAGKTTLMNVIAGTLTPDHGRIELSGADVSGLAPELRSLFGLARSFQDASLFPGLTVTELLQVAASGRNRIGFVSAAVTAPWVRNAEVGSRAEAAEVEARFGLEAWADTLTSDLSTGTRRICDLAAQVIARPKLLLLDEPTGGVAQREAEAFGPLLRRIRSELDCSILIIEHDMPLLMGLCDRVYAMDLGQVIAEGSPEEIRNTPAVIASYLGTDETAIGRSGTATRSGSV